MTSAASAPIASRCICSTRGWQPIIFTGAVPAGYPADPTPLGLAPSVEVVRDYAPAWWPVRRNRAADGTNPDPVPINTSGRVRRWFQARTTLPLRRDVLLTPRTALRARRRMRSTPIDLVFATGPPWGVLLQGFAASRVTGAPLCLDLRDPWTQGFLHRGMVRWVRWVERRTEAYLLTRADRVILTSEDAADAYRRLFGSIAPQHFTVIRNSFEPALRPPAQPRAARPTIVHFGNCYDPRTLAPVLRAIAELRRQGSAARLRLLNLGRVRESDVKLAERSASATASSIVRCSRTPRPSECSPARTFSYSSAAPPSAAFRERTRQAIQPVLDRLVAEERPGVVLMGRDIMPLFMFDRCRHHRRNWIGTRRRTIRPRSWGGPTAGRSASLHPWLPARP